MTKNSLDILAEEEPYYVTPRHEISARCPVPNLRAISDIKERCKGAKAWLECRKQVIQEIEERGGYDGH